jgi:hypothetical protein
MKKVIFLIVVVALVFPACLKAQRAFGIKAGVNLASATNLGNSGFQNGFVAGCFAEYFMARMLAFQPEIQYSQQGAKASDPYYVKADYINVPLMIKLFPVNNLYLEIGPQFALCVKAKGTSMVNGVPLSYNSIDEVNPFDFNIAGGLGFEFVKGPVISARYFVGIFSIDRNGTIDGRSGENHNMVIQLSVGWKF